MVPRIGHIALILPNYARAPIDDDELGVFEYLGDSRWQTLSDRRRPRDVLRIREVA
jgi:hypothetical protein